MNHYIAVYVSPANQIKFDQNDDNAAVYDAKSKLTNIGHLYKLFEVDADDNVLRQIYTG